MQLDSFQNPFIQISVGKLLRMREKPLASSRPINHIGCPVNMQASDSTRFLRPLLLRPVPGRFTTEVSVAISVAAQYLQAGLYPTACKRLHY